MEEDFYTENNFGISNIFDRFKSFGISGCGDDSAFDLEYEQEDEYEEEDEDDWLDNTSQRVINQIYELLLPLIILKKIIDYPIEEMDEIMAYEEMDEIMHGKIIFKNGNVYEGDIVASRFHGKGYFLWSDGAIYQGNFYRNYARGCGTFTNPGEDYYVGHFSQGVSSHGVSNLKTKNFTYMGSFLNGLFHGKGIFEALPLYFDGEFAFDLPLTGIRTYENGKFVGEFDINGYRKYGKYIFSNNDLYYGNWFDDKYNDFGVYQWSFNIHIDNPLITHKDTYYSGFWVDGDRNGIGLIRFEEIFIISQWKLDRKEGCGLIRAANGQYFVSKIMFEMNQYYEGMLLILNDETKNILKTLIHFPNKFDGRNYCHLNDSKSDEYIQCQNIFNSNICELLLHTNGKTEFTPYFLSNYQIDKDLACLNFINTIPNNLQNTRESITLEIELKCLRQSIQDNYHDIKLIYLKYATFNKNFINISVSRYVFMNRLGLWLFYKDVLSNIPRINIMDNIELCDDLYHLLPKDSLDNNDPVYFWEFLRHLIHIIIILNKTNCTIFEQAFIEKETFFGLYGTMFLIFLREFSVIQNIEQESLQWKLILETPTLIQSLLNQIHQIQNHLNIRETYKFFHKIKSITDKRIKNDVGNFLGNVTDSIFIECCTKIFPNMMKDEFFIDICFSITPLEICEIIFLCFEKEIMEKRKIMQKDIVENINQAPNIKK